MIVVRPYLILFVMFINGDKATTLMEVNPVPYRKIYGAENLLKYTSISKFRGKTHHKKITSLWLIFHLGALTVELLLC